MDGIDDFFPYATYRPHQRRMLETAAATARSGGLLLIDAPTGSGRSSVVAALLAERKERPIIVAVRTVSQLTTFIRELQLVRRKRPGLKFAYLIGKGTMCPLAGSGDVYRRCEGVKAFSSALMLERAQKGSMVPSKDLLIKQQLRRNSADHPLLCPYYIHSKVFVDQEGAGLRMVPSSVLRSKADRVASEVIWPDQLQEICGECCPYETMMQAARGADVVLVNFHHVFDEGIREQLYLSMGIEASEVILLVDEAHNCGDAIQGIQSVELDDQTLDAASLELTPYKKSMPEAEAVQQVLPQIRAFMEVLKSSREAEDWFDPSIFTRMILRSTLYGRLEDLVDDLLSVRDEIREKQMKAGDFRESAIERVTDFLYRCHQSAGDPAYITVYRREETGIVLEVRNIDPGAAMQDIAASHAACIFISGTLSPIESYRRYYFGDRPAEMLSLPNAFPREHRLVLAANDITSAYSMRENRENIAFIGEYIKRFASMPGNRAVYFPSYQILETFADACSKSLAGRKVFVEPRDAADANAALREFLSLPSKGRSGVLFAVCGGKWSEGLDYRGEMLSGAMVIGLPLAPYTRVRRMVIEYFRNKFGEEGEFISYTLPAINRALQALGRVIRTEEDRGVLVLGDRRFLEERVRTALPAWMQEEMQASTIGSFKEAVARWR